MDWLIYPGWVLAFLLVIVGLAGTILPALPGVPIVLLGLLLMTWLDGFVNVGFGTLAGLVVLTVLSMVIDFLATAEGARRFGAGRLAMLGALVGVVVGIFFGLPGLLFGPFLGAIAGHLLAKGSLDTSLDAGIGATLGVVVGTLAKVVIALIMLIWFTIAWWL